MVAGIQQMLPAKLSGVFPQLSVEIKSWNQLQTKKSYLQSAQVKAEEGRGIASRERARRWGTSWQGVAETP